MVHLGKTVGATCKVCGGISGPVSRALGVCLDCIRERWDAALPHVEAAHEGARRRHGLPGRPPKTDGGIPCGICSNGCVIGEGEKGFCGLRWNDSGFKSLTDAGSGLIYTYLDPHVTNCCSAWFCPGGTGAGYPEYAHRIGPELGHANLAAFLYGCNFDCLFCQNASHKDFRGTGLTTAEALARRVEKDPRISCVCYFGGSPEPQFPFALRASEMMMEARRGEPFRVCFEWNGCGDPSLARRAAELSLESGGNVKFDLKCSTPELSLALSGVPNERAYENFKMIADEYYPQRKELPVLTATTLLVPGYVDASEVEAISRFIADLDSSIPYGLLAFHPKYQMADLPYTSLRQAVECYRAARRNLERVRVGNLPLLGLGSMAQFVKLAGGS